MAELKKYILLPRKGFFHEALREFEPAEAPLGRRSLSLTEFKFAGRRNIIDSIAANGPKLVELDDLAAKELNRHPDLRAVLDIQWAKPRPKSIFTASFPLTPPPPTAKLQGFRKAVTLRVMETKKGKKVPIGSGMLVTALYSKTKNIGQKKSTDKYGEVTLRFSGDIINRLYCEYVWGWGAFRKDFHVQPPADLELEPLSSKFTDGVRLYYGHSRFNPRMDVTVGVIDTGVGPQVDLNIIGGHNMTGGSKKDYRDDDNHGTFVAGLIGSRGIHFPNLRGLAPGVRIRSYKVFGEGPDSGGDYALMKALWQAASDECDIVNLSIESPENIPEKDLRNGSLQTAITDARQQGMIVVVAAGNDGGKVDYPAAYPGTIAVSAMGRKETFPPGVIEEMTIKPPKGKKDPKEFIASFSNFGKQISVTALGVGVLSTLPHNKYGSCSGTSMAAPVVTGAAACLLSRNKKIFKMPRDSARADAIEKLLFDHCVKRGFGPKYEGHGMPDPKKV